MLGLGEGCVRHSPLCFRVEFYHLPFHNPVITIHAIYIGMNAQRWSILDPFVQIVPYLRALMVYQHIGKYLITVLLLSIIPTLIWVW